MRARKPFPKTLAVLARRGSLLLLGLALFACNDKSVDGGDPPPRLIPEIAYLSTSYADDYVYFRFGGDTVLAGGTYRYNVETGEGPELVVARTLIAAVSPDGKALAYINYFGDLLLTTLPTDDPYNPQHTVVAPGGPSLWPIEVCWRGPDRMLIRSTCDHDSCYGIYEYDVKSGETTFLIHDAFTPSASHDGSIIAYSNCWLVRLRGTVADSLLDGCGGYMTRDEVLSWVGDEIAFVHWLEVPEDEIIRFDLEVINAVNHGIRMIASRSRHPAWLRDGRILYVSIDGTTRYQMWITDPLGMRRRKVLEYDDFYDP